MAETCMMSLRGVDGAGSKGFRLRSRGFIAKAPGVIDRKKKRGRFGV